MHRTWQRVRHAPRVALGLLALSFCSHTAAAQTFSLLYSFANARDGAYPSAGVIRDEAGNLYGTTWYGGAHQSGTVFKLSPQHRETVLYSFSGQLDGGSPVVTSLLRDSLGNLYGTTDGGGAYRGGVVFRVTPAGKEVVLYNFGAALNDGNSPGDLTMDAAGNLYGATQGGGALNFGTVFKLDKSGNETILYSFTGTNGDGANPGGHLVLDSAGNLYGVTGLGGYLNQGTVFKLEANGTETILHTFLGGTDGSHPGGLTGDGKGNLYGTTGGATAGTVFKIDPSGALTTLFTFDTQNGEYPSGRLALDSSGNLYGTTLMGGNEYPYGTVFKLDPSGNETVLHNFTGGKDGKYPFAEPLAVDPAGSLYGTTQQGGVGGNGVIFKIKP
jgi:uncharacterized repeat protein (TIGR03803 family)